MAKSRAEMLAALPIPEEKKKTREEMLAELPAPSDVGGASLESRVKSTFSTTPEEFAKQAWQRGAKELQGKYGPENVSILQGDQGPYGFKVREKTIHGYSRDLEVPGDRVKEEIASDARRRQALRDEIERVAESIPAFDRFNLPFKSGSEGPKNYLKAIYEGADVRATGDGRYVVLRPGQAPLITDKQGPELADVADLGADVVRTAPGMAAQIGTAAVLGRRGALPPMALAAAGAAGDIVGEAAAQGYGAYLPGEENVTAGDRLKSGAVNVGAGLVSEGATSAMGHTLGDLRSASNKYTREMVTEEGENITARQAAKRGEAQIEAAGFEPEDQMTLTPGQVGGFRAMQREMEARASRRGQPLFKQADAKQAENLSRRVDMVMEDAFGVARRRGASGTAAAVEKAFTDYSGKLIDVHTKAAIEHLHRSLRGRAEIPAKDILAALSSAEGDEAFRRSATRLSKDLQFAATKSARDEAVWKGATAAESAKIYSSPATARIRAQDLETVIKDLAKEGPEGRELASKIVQGLDDKLPGMQFAKEHLMEGLSSAQQVKERIVGQMLSKFSEGGGSLTSNLLSSPGKDVSFFMTALQKLDPKAHKELAAQGIQELMERARPMATSELGRITSKDAMDPGQLASIILGKDQERLMALAGEGTKLAGQLKALASVSQKASRTAGKYPEKTFKVGGALARGLSYLPGALFLLGPHGAKLAAARVVPSLFSHRNMAKMFTDPASVRILMQLSDPPKWYNARAAARAVNELLIRHPLEDVTEEQP